METISGQVESQRQDKTAIKINGKWLKFPPEATEEQLDKVKWKDYVEVTYNDISKGNPIIQSIRIIGKSDAAPEHDIPKAPQEPQGIETVDTIPKEVRAMKEATAQVIEMFELGGIKGLSDGHLELIATLTRYKIWNGKAFA